IAFNEKINIQGFRKIRKLGHTSEFDQIKSYVLGDNIRHINWKASAKNNHLMVNMYQDERAQPIYSIIDRGRVMKMPFNNMSLLNYALNASLAISYIAIKKSDKAGIISFSNYIDNVVIADRKHTQMYKIFLLSGKN